MRPTVLLGDGQGVEIIEPAHWVQLDSLVFRAPGRLRITADTQIRPEPQHSEFTDEDLRQRIETDLDSAVVITEIENHLPIGVRVSLLVASRQEDVYTDPILRIPRDQGFGVEAAPVDAQGRVRESLKASRRSSISKEDALVFLREGGVYRGMLIELSAQTASEVELLSADFIHVRMDMEMTLKGE